MHISYNDIVSRIEEPPLWWLNGVPRYDAFRPEAVGLSAHTEALLVHVRCQLCGCDFHVAACEPRPKGVLSYAGLLNTQRKLGVLGDPPRHGCTGDTMTAAEVAVLQFWKRSVASNSGYKDWHRVPGLERSLEESDAAQEERHLEAWSRIRRFRSRPEGLMGAWTPAQRGMEPFPPDFPSRLPNPRIERSSTTGKFIDTPSLSARRRLALLAITGRITADEFAELKNRPQTEYAPYEQRPAGLRPAWAEPLVEEIRAIDETVLANAIAGYRQMSAEQREERYCPGLGKLLFDLAITGRITPEEQQQILASLLEHRYSF